MEILLFLFAAILLPYALGSLSFSIIVTKILYHKDIRTFGSGNAGMTNVLRTFGKGAAALTLVGDIGKGVLAVCLARNMMPNFLFAMYCAAFCAVIGHIYPLYFQFKGGKAVSVAAGTIVALQPILILPLLLIFAGVFLASKMVSLASCICAACYPILTFSYYFFFVRDYAIMATIGAALVAGLVLWMHRGNLARIKAGTEYKFGQKKGGS